MNPVGKRILDSTGRHGEEVLIVGAGGLGAPHLALAEATNVLRRLELAGKLGRLEAGAAAQDLLRLEPTLLWASECGNCGAT